MEQELQSLREQLKGLPQKEDIVRLVYDQLIMWGLVTVMLLVLRAESQYESQSQELTRRQTEMDDLKRQIRELTEKYSACPKPEEVQRSVECRERNVVLFSISINTYSKGAKKINKE